MFSMTPNGSRLRLVHSATRRRLLATTGLAIGLTIVAAQPAKADSVCALAVPTTACTDPNGNGQVTIVSDGGIVITHGGTDVLNYNAGLVSTTVTGYLESTTAGRGVLDVTDTSESHFTYTGTGSTLVGQLGATNSTVLAITAPSITLNSGSILSLGTNSTALFATATGGAGSGDITATIDGDIVAASGTAVGLFSSNPASTGNIALLTIAGTQVRTTGGVGLFASTLGSGDISITNNSAISSAAGVNSFSDGIFVNGGSGDVQIINNGAIGTAQDRPGMAGIFASSLGAGTINVSGSGAIFSNFNGIELSTIGTGGITVNYGGNVSGGTGAAVDVDANGGAISVNTTGTLSGAVGIYAENSGAGAVTINSTGPVVSGTGPGIHTVTSGGAISVNAGEVASLTNVGIDVEQLDAAGTGAISLSTTGPVSGATGINIDNRGTGTVTATIGGDVRGDAGYAILIDSLNAAAGNVSLVTASGTRLRASGGDGIFARLGGPGDLIITNNSVISSAAGGANTLGNGIHAASTVSGTGDVTVINNGAIGASDDRAQDNGINARVLNAASAGEINVSGSGSIFSVDDGIVAENLGTGATIINYTGAINSTSGDGIEADSAGGNITINAAQVTSGGAGEAGIDAAISGGAGAISINATGAVSGDFGIFAENAGTGGVTVTTGVGLIRGDAGSAIDARNINAASTGNVQVTVGAGGATGTGDDAVIAVNSGSGNVTVNSNGVVSSNAGHGILTAATSGTTTINVTGGSVSSAGLDVDAIHAAAITGPIIVNVGGNVTASGVSGDALDLSTAGAKTVTIAAGQTVGSNGLLGFALWARGGSTLTVNNSGTLGAPGGIAIVTDAGTVATVNNVTGAVLNGSVSLSNGNDSIVNSGTWNLTPSFFVTSFGNGADVASNNAGGVINIASGVLIEGLETLTNAGTINTMAGVRFDAGNTAVANTGTFNAGGAINFAAGTDSFANNAGGTLNVAAGAVVTGLETLTNAGSINAASGITFDLGNTTFANTGAFNLAGALDLGAGTDAFANNAGGMLNLTGNASILGAEMLTNAGLINLGTFTLTGPAIAFTNAGTIDTGGNAGLAGFTTFNNAGTVDLAAGTFTAAPGVPFTNSGTIMADEGATTITGQSSFANTGTIDLQDGAVGAVLTITGNFAGSAGSNLEVDFNPTSADRLVITGAASGTTSVDANFLGGGLFNIGGVLVVDAASSSANAFVIGSVNGFGNLVDASLVQEGADYFLITAPNSSAFDPLAVSLLAGTLWHQSADEVADNTKLPGTSAGFSAWGRIYGGRDEQGDDERMILDGVEFDVDNELETRRYGAQFGFDHGWSNARVGVTGGYAWAKAEGDADLELKARGWNVGLYGQFGGQTGFHGSILAKHDRYALDLVGGAFNDEKAKARSTGVEGAIGYRFGIGDDGVLDANVGLSHVSTRIDDMEAFGLSYDLGKLTSTRGRAGVRAAFGSGGVVPFVEVTAYHEFDGDGRVVMFDGATTFPLRTQGKASWLRLEAGITGRGGFGPQIAAWADLGNRRGFGLRAAWRLGGTSGSDR